MQKEARLNGKNSDDGSELLNLLILAETMCKSYGMPELNEEVWMRVKRMEKERMERVANAKPLKQ